MLPPYWHVVARGVVPGLQDINRAEACGLVQAALIAEQIPVEQVTIWSDSENALRAVQQSVTQPVPAWQVALLQRLAATWFMVFQVVRRSSAKLRPTRTSKRPTWKPCQPLRHLGMPLSTTLPNRPLADDLDIAHTTCQQVADWGSQQADLFYHFVMYLCELTKLVVPLRRAVTASHVTVEEGASTETLQRGRDQWLQLQPAVEACPVTVTLPHGWQRQCGDWPDWFSTALQAWLEKLYWPTDLPADRTFAGITCLELLVSFTLETGCLPPQRTSGTWVDLLSPDGVMRPVILRELIVQLVQSVDMVRCRVAVQCWPSPRHHRLQCLWLCGGRGDRKGLLFRPALPNAHQVIILLQQMFDSDSPGELLRERSWSRRS